ncbi:ribosomal protein S7 domain-containing protein [Biscogniauxia mediterranea]|nr:ribosomal protein S7 domain-containing protein [Biscogniauxia mediterranea]
MSSRISLWGPLRSLAARTRPLSPPGPGRITAGGACISATRGLADDTTFRRPPYPGDHYDGITPPPPPPPVETPSKAPIDPKSMVETWAPNYLNAAALAALEEAATGETMYGDDEGLKFEKPERPGKHAQLQDRYHPVISQVTKMLMQDGKLSKAQRHMSLILSYLRTTTPKTSPVRPLVPGSPPADQLPMDPLTYLTVAIDSVAPLIRIRAIKGAAGGGQALDLPEPMAVRTRRRIAIQWILDAVVRKRSTGSGRAQFATRFGQEILAVVEGRSTVWDRRSQVHKQGTAARANLNHPAVSPRKKL